MFLTVPQVEFKSKQVVVFFWLFPLRQPPWTHNPAPGCRLILASSSICLLLINRKPSSPFKLIWMLWLFQHTRLHLYFTDIGPTAAYFPGELKSNSMCELVVTSLWKTDILTRRRKRVDSFLTHAQFARARGSHQCKQTYTVNAARLWCIIQICLFHVGSICWAGNSWLCVSTPTVRTHSTHICFLKCFFLTYIYFFSFFLPKLIVSQIPTILAPLRSDCGGAGTNKKDSSGAGRHPSTRQSSADTANKTVFKSAAPTSRGLSRSPDRTAHLRTLGPIIRALCRNTQCLQPPAQHPTWCH